MSVVQWIPIGSVAPDVMGDARRQALSVTQWLARVTNSYVAHEPGNGHLQLRWRNDSGSIVTPGFENACTVELHLRDLSMTFCEDGKAVPHKIDVEERSPAQVEAWFLVELLHRGIDRGRFSLALPYEIHGLITGDAEDYSPETYQAGLIELTRWFQNAGAALTRAATEAGASGEVVCLPNNLHLAAYVPVDKGGMNRTIRIGFAPGDEVITQPYFYVAAHDAPRTEVLTASVIVTGEDPSAIVDTFLRNALVEESRMDLQS